MRPDRARCTACRRTHVVLDAGLLPHRAYTVRFLGQALVGAACGQGHRQIAAELGAPKDTVRGWLRRARSTAEQLRYIGVQAVVALDPEALPTTDRGDPLAHAIEALVARRMLAGTVTPQPPKAIPGPRRVTRWIMAARDRLTTEAITDLQQIRTACPELDAAIGHVRSFATMMRDQRGDRLPAWIAGISADQLPHIKQFADGLNSDFDAVAAGLSSTWSSGQCEGQVNRAKLLKRQGYGRSGLPLLRQRILLA